MILILVTLKVLNSVLKNNMETWTEKYSHKYISHLFESDEKFLMATKLLSDSSVDSQYFRLLFSHWFTTATRFTTLTKKKVTNKR